ncbi:MAG: hypothetical protein PWQ57_2968 [Desulfovibrionales bacterium]|jgi:hypothetical protein|nr:hypothetical protein [Desulfovibrionales bacterium]
MRNTLRALDFFTSSHRTICERLAFDESFNSQLTHGGGASTQPERNHPMHETALKESEALLANWSDNGSKTKKCFARLKAHLENMDGVRFDWKARPGVTYSLRAAHAAQKDHSLFAMVDVIDDDPDNRWLSVCFYGEMITDPEERGDEVPGGLLGEDAACFDVDAWDEDLLAYVETRLTEAHRSAANGG